MDIGTYSTKEEGKCHVNTFILLQFTYRSNVSSLEHRVDTEQASKMTKSSTDSQQSVPTSAAV